MVPELNPRGMNEYGALRKVALRRPEQSFRSNEFIALQWQELNYLGAPDFARACAEYDAFESLLRATGTEIVELPATADLGLDAIYVRDAAIVSPAGMILCRMGKPARRAEPAAIGCALAAAGVAVLGAIMEPGCVEGGDVTWLDEHTLLVGRGYRTNSEGIEQLRALLGAGIELVEVPLPHWKGEADVFHLMSFLSPIAGNLALVYSPLLPVPFRQYLLGRGVQLVEVPDEEFDTMGCNVLALAPGRVLMLAGNPGTRQALECAGVDVTEYQGAEISSRGCGGPTCLTRPLLRD